MVAQNRYIGRSMIVLCIGSSMKWPSRSATMNRVMISTPTTIPSTLSCPAVSSRVHTRMPKNQAIARTKIA